MSRLTNTFIFHTGKKPQNIFFKMNSTFHMVCQHHLHMENHRNRHTLCVRHSQKGSTATVCGVTGAGTFVSLQELKTPEPPPGCLSDRSERHGQWCLTRLKYFVFRRMLRVCQVFTRLALTGVSNAERSDLAEEQRVWGWICLEHCGVKLGQALGQSDVSSGKRDVKVCILLARQKCSRTTGNRSQRGGCGYT